jgi:hypothetical protein
MGGAQSQAFHHTMIFVASQNPRIARSDSGRTYVASSLEAEADVSVSGNEAVRSLAG